MNTKIILASFFFVSILAIGFILFSTIDDEPIQDIISDNQTLLKKEGMQTAKGPAPLSPAKQLQQAKKDNKPDLGKNLPSDAGDPFKSMAEPEEKEYPAYIEDIKQQIYALNIESAEQIEQLDKLVQTREKDTRKFWNDDWTSVDDWKKNSNGFSLEKKEDGSLIFTPDAQTARTYSFFENPLAYKYDEENNEFVSEVDFYGKTIYNVAKFINDDVLVMMTISGRKVDLNIYQKFASQK